MRGLLPLSLAAGLLCACGESLPPRPRTPTPSAPLATTSPTGLAGVACAVDERLAGLRGEAARAYAGKLIEQALSTDTDVRRTQVLEALANGPPSLRWIGLLAVPHTGPLDDEMFRAVLRQTGTTHDYLDAAAHEILSSAEGIDDGAVTRMWLVARTAPAPLRAALYRALATHRPADGRKDVLRRALAADEEEVRRAAAFALLHLLPQVPPVPHPHADLLEDLARAAKNDPDQGVRVYAVNALARLGPAAAPAAGKLAALLQDPSRPVRTGAREALTAIGDPALPALRKALHRRNHDLTDAVTDIAQHIGTAAAQDLLRAGLEDPDPYVRGRCALALQALNASGVNGLAIYGQLLAEKNGDVVLLALEGLGQLSAEAGPALDGIRGLTQHADPRVRRAARVLLDFLDAR